MRYNFDEQINRHGTSCLKYDFTTKRGKPSDVLPLWVADMDFPVPKEIKDALTQAVSHGIFGYTDTNEDYFTPIHDWFYEHYHWDTKREWLITTPGVVFAIHLCVRAFTKPGDHVMIQRPVYYPFSKAIELNGRILVNSPLQYTGYRYEMNFQDLEKQIIEQQVKLFILCSPHNPVGRVWTIEELEKLADICLRHHVLIVSDEIHCDFTYPGHTHTVLASIRKEISDITITCTAPSKTFNLAGLQVSNIFIENETLRSTFRHELDVTGYSEINCLGLTACKAAYTYGSDWLSQLLVYLEGNIDYVRRYLAENLPNVEMVVPEGTYLLWLDFRAYHLASSELEEIMLHDAKLWLDNGSMFGPEGEHFQRINIACPRSVLEQAMNQLKNAFQ